jgi:hypothetical protein
MATSATSIDTNVITLRKIKVRDPLANTVIPSSLILISDGAGNAYWSSISTILPISTFNSVRANDGNFLNADVGFNTINVSSTGIQGLFDTYIDPTTKTLMLSNAAIGVQVNESSVPMVTVPYAIVPPAPTNFTFISGRSTLKFLGVGDVQLSTVSDQRAVFVSISTFTSAGYNALSGEVLSTKRYVASTFSTNYGYASFISSLSTANTGAGGWNWNAIYGSNIPLSTAEVYPSYTTGDIYFSTVTFTMANFIQYMNPNSTTKMFLEVHPSYMFQRSFLGSQGNNYTLIKPISTFIQYVSPTTQTTTRLPESHMQINMTSQQSNTWTSNFYDTPFKLELNTATVQSNYAVDGNAGYYTLYHRMVGGMAELISDGYCAYLIGRSGFSNATPVYDNRTPGRNGVYLHIYNQAAPF